MSFHQNMFPLFHSPYFGVAALSCGQYTDYTLSSFWDWLAIGLLCCSCIMNRKNWIIVSMWPLEIRLIHICIACAPYSSMIWSILVRVTIAIISSFPSPILFDHWTVNVVIACSPSQSRFCSPPWMLIGLHSVAPFSHHTYTLLSFELGEIPAGLGILRVIT